MNIELPNNSESKENVIELVKKIEQKNQELVILSADKELINFYSKLQLNRENIEDAPKYEVTDNERIASETFRQLLKEISELSEQLQTKLESQK